MSGAHCAAVHAHLPLMLVQRSAPCCYFRRRRQLCPRLLSRHHVTCNAATPALYTTPYTSTPCDPHAAPHPTHPLPVTHMQLLLRLAVYALCSSAWGSRRCTAHQRRQRCCSERTRARTCACSCSFQVAPSPSPSIPPHVVSPATGPRAVTQEHAERVSMPPALASQLIITHPHACSLPNTPPTAGKAPVYVWSPSAEADSQWTVSC